MPDFPSYHLPPHRVISTLSLESLGVPYNAFANAEPTVVIAWALANRVTYVPLRLSVPFNLARFWWGNGSTTPTGLVTLGLYSKSGRKLIETAATAPAGTTVTQSVAPTVGTVLVPPGIYYLAMVASLTGGSYLQRSISARGARWMGMYEENGAGGLPTLATFAANIGARLPIFGISEHALI